MFLLLFSCDDRLPFETLYCVSDSQCEALWPNFAPVCAGGICSQCEVDDDCAGGICVVGLDGFGTCVPEAT